MFIELDFTWDILFVKGFCKIDNNPFHGDIGIYSQMWYVLKESPEPEFIHPVIMGPNLYYKRISICLDTGPPKFCWPLF